VVERACDHVSPDNRISDRVVARRRNSLISEGRTPALEHRIIASYAAHEVLDPEPQDDAVRDRRRGGIDEIGVPFLVPGV
jgi:hypothetical protein